MKRAKKGVGSVAQVEIDPIDVVNSIELDKFVAQFMPDRDSWKTWIHPKTQNHHTISLEASTTLSEEDLYACFNLIEHSSAEDYKKSKEGWKPKAKLKEMKLLDLKYLLIHSPDNKVRGFCSFMPTYEDGYAVIYCYEIHLGEELQGTGLGKHLMDLIYDLGSRILHVSKIMLTVFVRNERGVKFYQKLGYEKDEFSPPSQVLRNGTKLEAEYLILSKVVVH